MKKIASFILALFFLFPSCSQDNEKEQKILCRINNYPLLLEDFQQQLAMEVEMNNEFKLTRKARKDFLEGLIKKELLIQAAKRQHLDREEKFIKAIERYWESTLIRDLMDKKGKEINSRIFVTEEEIQTRYEKMKTRDPSLPPITDMEIAIASMLKEEKKTRMLDEWLNHLKSNAKIEIDERLL